MKSEQIVSWLRDKAARAEGRDYRKMLTVAAEKIVELETELREEMHRHDRLQDFEVAEAQLLAEYKNTGLTPEQAAFLVSPDMQEVAQLMKECLEIIESGEPEIFGLPVERVMQLVEEEKAGARNRWIPVTERLPENFISVLGYMPDAAPFPTVRECYTIDKVFFFPALNAVHPVTHWRPMPEEGDNL